MIESSRYLQAAKMAALAALATLRKGRTVARYLESADHEAVATVHGRKEAVAHYLEGAEHEAVATVHAREGAAVRTATSVTAYLEQVLYP